MRDVPRAGRLVDRAVVSRFDLVAAGALRAGVVGYERLESEAMAGSRKSVARATPGRGDENVPAIKSLLSSDPSRLAGTAGVVADAAECRKRARCQRGATRSRRSDLHYFCGRVCA